MKALFYPFIKKLIVLRKEKKLISKGKIEFLENENKNVLAYKGTWQIKRWLYAAICGKQKSRNGYGLQVEGLQKGYWKL